MAEFVQRRRVIGLGRFKRTHRRQVDEIECPDETRPIAAVPDVGVGGHDEGVHRGKAFRLRRKRPLREAEAVDLRDVVHCDALRWEGLPNEATQVARNRALSSAETLGVLRRRPMRIHQFFVG